MIPYIHTNPYRPPQWADQPRSKFPRRREMLRGKGVRQSTSKVQLWWEFPWFNMIQDYSSRKWWKLMDGQETCRRSLETRLVCHSATLPTHPEVMTWTRATAMWQGLASFLNMLSALESQLRLIEVNYISLHHHLVHWNHFFFISGVGGKKHIPNHEPLYLLVFIALATGPEKRPSPCNFFVAHPWCTCPNNLSKARGAWGCHLIFASPSN